MSFLQYIFVGFGGAIIGATSAYLYAWFQSVRLARVKFAAALFRLEHTLKHRKTENPYDTITDQTVFEIWELGMTYITLYPPGRCAKERKSLGFLLGLMTEIEPDVKHALSDRSLPSPINALKYINELFILLGYKSR